MQVGKAYFELVDYLEADWAFSLAHQASPYSLEGMDMYSTVLYVSSHYIVLEKIVHFSPGCNLKINSLRASPATLVILADQKHIFYILPTTFSIKTPTDSIFFKYYLFYK